MILAGFSLQGDATVKCWGYNVYGQLGLGDSSDRGDDVNGPFPSEHHHRVSMLPRRVLTLAPALRVQRWGRTSLRST